MSSLLAMLGDLLTSKKFIAMIAGLVATLLAKWKLNVDPITIAGMISMVVSFIIGQGLADNGKEAAKVNAVATVANNPNVSTPESNKAVEELAKQVKE